MPLGDINGAARSFNALGPRLKASTEIKNEFCMHWSARDEDGSFPKGDSSETFRPSLVPMPVACANFLEAGSIKNIIVPQLGPLAWQRA